MTRRTLLSFLPAGLVAAAPATKSIRSKPLPAHRGEFVRFSDPVTENIVVRLTHPTSTSLMTQPQNRFVSSREAFLIFASDRAGAMAPFRVNLRTGNLQQIAEPKALMSRSFSLDSSEKRLFLIDQNTLQEVDLQRLRSRTIAENVTEFHVAGRTNEIVILRNRRLEHLNSEESSPIAEDVDSRAFVSPNGDGCAFCRKADTKEHELWYARFGNKAALLAKGNISCPYWRPDGQALLFLRQVDRGNYLASEVHEVPVAGGPEKFVSRTSQYAAFAPNGDGSVFVGASRSKAQPNIMLLLRDLNRELTLCEHHASRPETVTPQFSPNSQRVYYQSDHEGKSAIYSVNVELLVEPTEDRG